MIKIKGYMLIENERVDREFTLDEIANYLKDNYHGMLSLSGYTIRETGMHAHASALTLFPNESIPFEEEGKIVIPASFRRFMIYGASSEADNQEIVTVHCVIDPEDRRLHLSMSK